MGQYLPRIIDQIKHDDWDGNSLKRCSIPSNTEWGRHPISDSEHREMKSLRFHPRDLCTSSRLIQNRSHEHIPIKRGLSRGGPAILILLLVVGAWIVVCVIGTAMRKRPAKPTEDTKKGSRKAQRKTPGTADPPSSTPPPIDSTPEMVTSIQAPKMASMPPELDTEGLEDEELPAYKKYERGLPKYAMVTKPTTVMCRQTEQLTTTLRRAALERQHECDTFGREERMRIAQERTRQIDGALEELWPEAEVRRKRRAEKRRREERQKRNEQRDREMESAVVIW